MLQIRTASLLQIRASVVTNRGSYYNLGQLLLQNRTAIRNWGKMYYKLRQVLQIRAIITNWGITDGTQNYLVFQPTYRYFKVIANTRYISSWKSKGLSDESIKRPTTSDNSLYPLIDYLCDKIRLKFNASCLKQAKLTYTHGKTVSIYIVYELTDSSSNDDDSKVRNSLFGAVRLTKNTDIDKYGYSGNGIGFDRRERFSFPGCGFRSNVIIFGVDTSSSVHADIKKRTF